MRLVLGLSAALTALTLNTAFAQSDRFVAYADDPTVVASQAPQGMVPAQPRSNLARSNLGGGFIEFLFNGGQAGDEPAPRRRAYVVGQPDARLDPRYVRPRRAPAYAGLPDQDYPGQSYANEPDPGQRYAYGEPPSAARPRAGMIAAKFQRQTVDYASEEAPGTVVIDTSQRFLYLVQDGGKALRYGVGVGREGFEWTGTNTISRKAEWPDWRPPKEMLKRRPELPAYMAGGPRNPLGARAMYLGSTLFRIHGSNEPQSIGQAVSSGCIRMRNEDVMDLYERVNIGTKVVVM